MAKRKKKASPEVDAEITEDVDLYGLSLEQLTARRDVLLDQMVNLTQQEVAAALRADAAKEAHQLAQSDYRAVYSLLSITKHLLERVNNRLYCMSVGKRAV